MYRVLKNAITDRHRREGARARGQERLAREPTAADDELDRVVCECIGRALETLPAAQSEILERVELGDVAVKDYAERAGITANSAGVRVFRARKALRARVMEACGVCAEHACVDCTCQPKSS